MCIRDSPWRVNFQNLVEERAPAVPESGSELYSFAEGYVRAYNERLEAAASPRGMRLVSGAYMTLDYAIELIERRRDPSLALDNPDFLLECWCDAMSVDVLFALAESLSFGAATVARGLALGLQNLRWLQSLDYFLHDERREDMIAATNLRESMWRRELMRRYVTSKVESLCDDPAGVARSDPARARSWPS